MNTQIPQQWRDLITSLPGFDPFANPGLATFDIGKAEGAIQFVETLCHHTKGARAGQRFTLERWQKATIANLFGWTLPDGSRRFRKSLIFVPRKNGKTTTAAAIVLLSMYRDAEPGAEIYSAAAKRDQARLVFDQVVGMIRQEPELSRHANIYRTSVVVGSASYKPISSDAATEHGGNTHLAIVDELHAQPNRELVDVLETSTAARTQPLIVHLTTSDYERESICNEVHGYAAKVRDGIIDDPSFLPVIYEAGVDDEWTTREVWAAANPNLGVSVSEDYMRRECIRAQDDPSYENTFKRLHLNIRTEAMSRWITSDKWDACQADVRLEDFAGQACFAGLDLASTQDFNAFVMTFKRDGEFYVFPRFWAPEATAAKREKERRIPYSVWARGGHLTLTPGDVSDPDTIHKDITSLVDEHKLNVREVAVDRMFQGMDLIRRLVADGLTAFAHGQGSMGMIPPTKVAKDAIIGGTLKHDGNPVLRWMMSNVVVHPGESTEYPMRDKSADKIDGPVAMIMAVGRADIVPALKESYYATHFIEIL